MMAASKSHCLWRAPQEVVGACITWTTRCRATARTRSAWVVLIQIGCVGGRGRSTRGGWWSAHAPD